MEQKIAFAEDPNVETYSVPLRSDGLDMILAYSRYSRILGAVASSIDLTTRELTIAIALFSRDFCCIHKLAELLDMNVTTLSKVLRSLQAKDLILRNRQDGDRRKEIVCLSSKGVHLIGSVLTSVGKTPSELADGRIHWRADVVLRQSV